MSKKLTPENFMEGVTDYLFSSLQDNAQNASSSNLTVYFDGQNMVVNTKTPLSTNQDIAKILIEGGGFLTAEGEEKLKNKKQLDKDDYILTNGIGSRI